jgi:hypothetical protein
MKTVITPGSIVSGESGKTFLVDRVEGDIIYSGKVKFMASAVLKVIPPHAITNFKLGDRVEYIGSDLKLKTQYAGILEVWEISKKDIGSYACLKANGRVTSWIEFADIQLVEAN